MQLVRLGQPSSERPAARNPEGGYWDLSGLTDDITPDFVAGDGIRRAADAVSAGNLPRLDVGDVRVGPPISPGAIIAIGQNYAAHAAESGAAPPKTPVIFLKTPNTVVGPCDDVVIPPGSQRTDWEVELGVVMGRPASYLDSPEDAREHIAGYVICNDVSERTYQLDDSGGQWSKGKCCPTFNPLGPWLVTPDEVGDPGNLRLASWVNGEPRQDSTTADMIFAVDYLVWHLSQYLTLDPGYVISTGTPEGVALSGRFPYLKAGDVMELEIEGLGRQRQRLVSASGAAAG